MAVLTYTETLEITSCWCGAPLAIEKSALANVRRHKGKLWCPTTGHEMWFSYETEAEKKAKTEASLRERAEADAARLRARLDQSQAANTTLRRSRSALKGEVTKARKRAARTQCPVADCKRTFAPTNMQRHVDTEHPHWHPEPALEQL